MNIDFTHLSNADLLRMQFARSAINNHAYFSDFGRVGKFLADTVWGKGAQKHYDNWKELSGADFPRIADKSGKEWFDFEFSHNMGLRGLFSQEHMILRESDIPTYIKSSILLQDKDVSFEAKKILEYGLNQGLSMEQAANIVVGDRLDDDHIMKNVVQQLSQLGLSEFGVESDIEFILEGLHNIRGEEADVVEEDRSLMKEFTRDVEKDEQDVIVAADMAWHDRDNFSKAGVIAHSYPRRDSALSPTMHKLSRTGEGFLDDLICQAESTRVTPAAGAKHIARESEMEL